jgi:hypothetical protein
METQSFYTIALCVVAGGMSFIAGLMGYLYRQRDDQYEQAARRVNDLTTKLERKELLTKRLDENGKKSENTADYYTNRCDQLQQEIDTLRRTVTQYEEWCNEKQQTIDLLKSERATLYRRNEKGQIVPITPKPRKPHTLKHGMTVKYPTPKQAERIFKEARRAGIIGEWDGSISERHPNIYFGVLGPNEFCSCCLANGPATSAYITATEFIKRIKGEVA